MFLFSLGLLLVFRVYDEGHRHCQRHHRTANPQGVMLVFFIAMVVSPSVCTKAGGVFVYPYLVARFLL